MIFEKRSVENAGLYAKATGSEMFLGHLFKSLINCSFVRYSEHSQDITKVFEHDIFSSNS